MHMAADDAEVDHEEGSGALNFLAIDDLSVIQEGEAIDPDSVVTLEEEEGGKPVFPHFDSSCSDIFLRQVECSGKKWVILTDTHGEPQMVLDSDGFLRHALFHQQTKPYVYCHRPIIVRDLQTSLGDVLSQLKVEPQRSGDDVIDHDIILIWGPVRRVITGADILGRLMQGIITTTKVEDSSA